MDKLEHKYTDFNYWFYPDGYNTFAIYNIKDKPVLLHEGVDVNKIPSLQTDIVEDFCKYKYRPEYFIFNFKYQLYMKSYREAYENIMISANMIQSWRAGSNPDDYITSDRFKSMMTWLDSTDFYTCPGSTVYHDSYKSGLLIHTFRVIEHVLELRSIPAFNKVRIEDIIICAAVHDWCKIGRYEPYTKNVKNSITGRWEQVQSYKYNTTGYINLGHGTTSLYLASKFLHITTEMAAAIRWHMGEYNVATNEASELHECNEKYPMVFMLQFADRLAITSYRG